MAVFDGKLVFTAPADGSGKLVFGEEFPSDWMVVSSVKVWNGSAWVQRNLRVFDGVAWQTVSLKIWIGG